MKKGTKHSEETKRKISIKHKGNKLSEGHKKKISNSLIGKYKGITIEERYGKEKAKELIKKMSKTFFKKGFIPWNKGLKLRKWSEEEKKKRKGQVPWNKGLKGEEFKSHYLNGFIVPSNLGKHHTEEAKRKIGLGHKGMRHSEESKRKMSKSLKGNVSYMKGKKHTEEAKEKMRIARAKQILPVKDTKIEVKIQNFLEQLGIEYFTHKYMKIEHGYQCDILIPSMNLVIECDGDYWHKYPVGLEKDHIRTKELIEKGFKVLRLWEREIKAMSIIQFKEVL